MDKQEEFVALTRQRAEATAKEIKELNHKLAAIGVEIARTAHYIQELNKFLVENGKEPIPFEGSSR